MPGYGSLNAKFRLEQVEFVQQTQPMGWFLATVWNLTPWTENRANEINHVRFETAFF